MSWTTPKTWTAALVTVAEFNTHLRDNLLAILPAGPALTSVAHSGGNFTAGSGSWTVASGDQTTFAYVEIGKIMVVTFVLVNTSVSATPSDLRIAIPNSKTAARSMSAGMFAYNENGTAGVGPASVSGTTIFLYKTLAAPAWSTSTDTTSMQGTLVFEVS